MKITKIVSAMIVGLSGNVLMAAPELKINCTKAPYSVEVEMESEAKASFSLKLNSEVVGTGDLKVMASAYESSFLNAYILGFQAENDKAHILVGIPELKELVPGTYEAKSDLIVIANDHVMDGSTLDCTVVVK